MYNSLFKVVPPDEEHPFPLRNLTIGRKESLLGLIHQNDNLYFWTSDMSVSRNHCKLGFERAFQNPLEYTSLIQIAKQRGFHLDAKISESLLQFLGNEHFLIKFKEPGSIVGTWLSWRPGPNTPMSNTPIKIIRGLSYKSVKEDMIIEILHHYRKDKKDLYREKSTQVLDIKHLNYVSPERKITKSKKDKPAPHNQSGYQLDRLTSMGMPNMQRSIQDNRKTKQKSHKSQYDYSQKNNAPNSVPVPNEKSDIKNFEKCSFAELFKNLEDLTFVVSNRGKLAIENFTNIMEDLLKEKKFEFDFLIVNSLRSSENSENCKKFGIIIVNCFDCSLQVSPFDIDFKQGEFFVSRESSAQNVPSSWPSRFALKNSQQVLNQARGNFSKIQQCKLERSFNKEDQFAHQKVQKTNPFVDPIYETINDSGNNNCEDLSIKIGFSVKQNGRYQPKEWELLVHDRQVLLFEISGTWVELRVNNF